MTPERRGDGVDIARIDGRIDGLRDRIIFLEGWQKKSEEFHMEMRGRWDHFDGAQEQQEKTQALRHRENQEKLNVIAIIASLALLVVTALGVYVAYKESQHAKAIISNQQPTAVAEQQSAHW